MADAVSGNWGLQVNPAAGRTAGATVAGCGELAGFAARTGCLAETSSRWRCACVTDRCRTGGMGGGCCGAVAGGSGGCACRERPFSSSSKKRRKSSWGLTGSPALPGEGGGVGWLGVLDPPRLAAPWRMSHTTTAMIPMTASTLTAAIGPMIMDGLILSRERPVPGQGPARALRAEVSSFQLVCCLGRPSSEIDLRISVSDWMFCMR